MNEEIIKIADTAIEFCDIYLSKGKTEFNSFKQDFTTIKHLASSPVKLDEVSSGGEGWISVEDRPLFTKDKNDWWTLTPDGQKEIIAAVPYNDSSRPNETNLWWIHHCVIDDGGLKVVGEMDNEPAGYSLEDVTHYKIFPSNPKH